MRRSMAEQWAFQQLKKKKKGGKEDSQGRLQWSANSGEEQKPGRVQRWLGALMPPGLRPAYVLLQSWQITEGHWASVSSFMYILKKKHIKLDYHYDSLHIFTMPFVYLCWTLKRWLLLAVGPFLISRIQDKVNVDALKCFFSPPVILSSVLPCLWWAKELNRKWQEVGSCRSSGPEWTCKVSKAFSASASSSIRKTSVLARWKKCTASCLEICKCDASESYYNAIRSVCHAVPQHVSESII